MIFIFQMEGLKDILGLGGRVDVASDLLHCARLYILFSNWDVSP